MKARRTIYRGTPMRSRTEALFAAALDRADDAWEYEPDCFADQYGQYLPDFVLGTGAARLYVEVKPTFRSPGPLLDRMARIKSSVPDALLAVTFQEHPGYLWARAGDGPTSFWCWLSTRTDRLPLPLWDAEPITPRILGDVEFPGAIAARARALWDADLPGVVPYDFDWQWHRERV